MVQEWSWQYSRGRARRRNQRWHIRSWNTRAMSIKSWASTKRFSTTQIWRKVIYPGSMITTIWVHYRRSMMPCYNNVWIQWEDAHQKNSARITIRSNLQSQERNWEMGRTRKAICTKGDETTPWLTMFWTDTQISINQDWMQESTWVTTLPSWEERRDD